MADINSLIADSRNYAGSAFSHAQTELSGASSVLNSITSGFDALDPTTPTIAAPKPFVPAIPPQLLLSILDTSGLPGDLPAPTPIPDILSDVGRPPLLTAKAPTINFDAIRTPSQLAEFSASLPQLDTNFVFPDAPVLMAPVPLTFNEYVVPSAPEVRLPVFDALRPDDLAAPNTDYVTQFNATYRDMAPTMFAAIDGQMDTIMSKYNPQFASQMAALEGRLATFMAGGSGLTPAVEDAIFERTRDKTDAEYRRTRDTAYDETAKRGFTLPNGALTSAIFQARQAGADNNARAAIDIAVKQAELEQQNIQFAVTASAQLRSMMVSATISYQQGLIAINGQALDAAKTVLNALIEVYNTLVKGFGAKIEGYKADATVYETRLRSAMAGIEVYKAEVQALESLVRVDQSKVERYKAEIDAMNALAGVYRTEVESVVARAQLERLKIDLFGAQVQAYGARTQAQTAEWQGYTAAVNGQEAKAKVFTEEVQAYTAEVNGYRAKVEAKAEQVRAISASNQAAASAYSARVAGYSAKVAAGAQKVGAEIDYQKQQLTTYAIASQAAIGYAQMNAEYFRVQSQISIERDRLNVTKLLETARIQLEKSRAISSNSVAAAGVYSNLASSALSGMNTLVTQTGRG